MWTGKAFFVGLLLGAGLLGIAQDESVKALVALVLGLACGFVGGVGLEDRYDIYAGENYRRRSGRGRKR